MEQKIEPSIALNWGKTEMEELCPFVSKKAEKVKVLSLILRKSLQNANCKINNLSEWK